jgi:hypothetical protein
VHVAAVVLPGDPEDDLALGLAQPCDHVVPRELGVLRQHRSERPEHIAYRLMELGLARIPANHLLVVRLDLLVEQRSCRQLERAAGHRLTQGVREDHDEHGDHRGEQENEDRRA